MNLYLVSLGLYNTKEIYASTPEQACMKFLQNDFIDDAYAAFNVQQDGKDDVEILFETIINLMILSNNMEPILCE